MGPIIQRSRNTISSPWPCLILYFFPHRAISWSPQSNGRDRHADKQLLCDDQSALASVPRTLEDAALNWVWERRVREREVEPSLERQGAFLWNPREKTLYSRQRSKQRQGGVRLNDTWREWQRAGDGCCTGCGEGLMERERLAGI